MGAGRPVKPTALKELAGNPGGRPLNDAEPKPRTTKPKMPSHLGEKAQREWRRVVREVSAMKILTSADADALALYCQTYQRWVEASEKIDEEGMVVTTDNGYPVMSPYITIVNQCIKTMQRLLTEFGMTPASRSRIRVPEKQNDDEFDAFLRRR